jgi:glycerol-3-phosphate O-acyltransferase
VYYKFGYAASRATLNMLYKVSVDYEALDALDELPRDAVVSLPGEPPVKRRLRAARLCWRRRLDLATPWANGPRAFPLEYVFQGVRLVLHSSTVSRAAATITVLEQYVQLITRNGVTQGVFPEGGLTRDGRLRTGKVGSSTTCWVSRATRTSNGDW